MGRPLAQNRVPIWAWLLALAIASPFLAALISAAAR